MATKLTPKMADRRAELAEAMVPLLEATQRRLDASWPASEGERKRLADEIEYWTDNSRAEQEEAQRRDVEAADAILTAAMDAHDERNNNVGQ